MCGCSLAKHKHKTLMHQHFMHIILKGKPEAKDDGENGSCGGESNYA